MATPGNKLVVDDLKRFLGDRYVPGGSDEVRKNLVQFRLLQASGILPESLQFRKNEVDNSSYKTTVARLGFGKGWDVSRVSNVQLANIGVGTSNKKVGQYFTDIFGDVPVPATQANPINPTASDELRGRNPTPAPSIPSRPRGQSAAPAPAAASGSPSEAARLRGQGLGTPSPSTPTPGPAPSGPVGPGSTGGGAPFNPGAGVDPVAVTDGQAWHNIPSDGELWKIDGVDYVAYQYEGGPFVYYKVPDKEWMTTRFPGGVPDPRELSAADANRLGALPMGSANLLANLGKTWQEGFDASIDRQLEFSPWLQDGEVVATILSATLEGRQLQPIELESTEWFSSRNDAEVAYATLALTTADKDLDAYHDAARENIRQSLTRAGVRSPSTLLIDYLAKKSAVGEWNEEKMARQIAAVSNPMSSIKMDAGLTALLDGTTLDTLAGAAEDVRTDVTDWIGPQHSAGFPDEWYRKWAGAIGDDPNAVNDLRDYLQGQRMALYPEYQNANLKYSDIAPVWENQMLQTWGQSPSDDRSWGTLDRLIRANDAAESSKILRGEGLNQGIEKVVQDFAGASGEAFGGQVVRSI